jgi:hypothetical protein
LFSLKCGKTKYWNVINVKKVEDVLGEQIVRIIEKGDNSTSKDFMMNTHHNKKNYQID